MVNRGRPFRATQREEPGLELGLNLLLGPVIIISLGMFVARYGPRFFEWIVAFLGGEEPSTLNISPSRPSRTPKLKSKPPLSPAARTAKAPPPSPAARLPPAKPANGSAAGSSGAASELLDTGLRQASFAVADEETVDTARALQETVEWNEVSGKRARAQRKAAMAAAAVADAADAAESASNGDNDDASNGSA